MFDSVESAIAGIKQTPNVCFATHVLNWQGNVYAANHQSVWFLRMKQMGEYEWVTSYASPDWLASKVVEQGKEVA